MLVSFSSTTIEEALVNDVPVLLYGGHGRYAHIPVKPFSSFNKEVLMPVTWVKTNKDLIEYFEILSEKMLFVKIHLIMRSLNMLMKKL